ncbi:MAG TPA: aminotransferase class I/II-fold pyridoxal phosphate-dependent enzyme [Acidobacteriota bacterium]|nr:aminotransferase class I/II-fold pyridoxal phosphate-dependent enzyme [Acidobacteriota bacterium]
MGIPNKRIYLSPPHMSGEELRLVENVFASNWIAPVGPDVDAFEFEFCEAVGAGHAVALSSGTAALHLALEVLGIGPGDEVICSDFTFAASANAIVYTGATPVFVDCDRATWNIDTALLVQALEDRAKSGKPPKAVIAVHIYGQSADLDPILEICERHGVILIEDAAESLGTTYKSRATGTIARLGTFSFNGNKIITTSGGGMLVSKDEKLVESARFLATQARDPAPHYQHSRIGYNYRLSNVLAAIGRGQLKVLEQRVAKKRQIFDFYLQTLGGLPGIEFMPEADYGRCNRWLTCLTIDPDLFGADREEVRLALEKENIESRPVWKPMHMQPVFAGAKMFGGSVDERIFERGLCLPSGTALTSSDLERIAEIIMYCRKS